jgi:hypothetical protein
VEKQESVERTSPALDSLSLFTQEEPGATYESVRAEVRSLDEPLVTRLASYPGPHADDGAAWMLDDGTAPFTRTTYQTDRRIERDRAVPIESSRQDFLVDHTRAEIARVTTLLSVLEDRVASLTAPGRVLDSAADTIADLERRASEATARLERAEREKDALERQVVTLQSRLQTFNQSPGSPEPPLRPQAPPVAQRTMAPARPKPAPSMAAPRPRVSPPPQRSDRGRRVVAVLGAVALIGVCGLLASRFRADSKPSSNSILSSRSLRSETFALPAGGSSARIGGAPALARTTATAVSPRTVVETPALVRTSASVPTSAPASRVVAASVAPTEKAPAFVGRLRIESVPSGATVFVNQQRVGETPLLLDRLHTGSHVIWLDRDGYERWSTSVLVSAAIQAHVSAKLQPAQKP